MNVLRDAVDVIELWKAGKVAEAVNECKAMPIDGVLLIGALMREKELDYAAFGKAIYDSQVAFGARICNCCHKPHGIMWKCAHCGRPACARCFYPDNMICNTCSMEKLAADHPPHRGWGPTEPPKVG